MKKAATVSLALFLSVTSSFGVTGAEIEEPFLEIMSKERSDFSQKIDAIKDPFVNANIATQTAAPEASADANKSTIQYELKAVISKQAKINDKWYKAGDAIGSYKLASVKNDTVVLLPDGSDTTLTPLKLKIESIKNLNVEPLK